MDLKMTNNQVEFKMKMKNFLTPRMSLIILLTISAHTYIQKEILISLDGE
jgi:hypothetical protein